MPSDLVATNPQIREQLDKLLEGRERWGWWFCPPGEPGLSSLRNSPPGETQAPDYAARYAQWVEAIREDEERARLQFLTSPVWYANNAAQASMGDQTAGVRDVVPIVNVYGGSGLGWRALLTTVGLSLLGNGHHLTITNLTERDVVGPLAQLADLCGFPTRLDEISSAGSSIDIFQGLSIDQLISIILGAVYQDDRDPSVAQDRALLRRVARALDEPVTLRRLQEALDCVLLEVPSGPEWISDTEFDRLSSLFGRDLREHGGVIERVARLESQVEEFAPFAELRAGQASEGEGGEAIHVIQVGREDLRDFDLAVEMVLQALLRQIRHAGSEGSDEVLIVAGADRIRGRAMEAVATAASENELRLILLFAHLREESMDALGAEDSRTLFMTLKDHREANTAAEFIGKDFKFELSGFTTSSGGSRGSSKSNTTGQEQGTNVSQGVGFGAQSSRGQSSSISSSVGLSESLETNWTRSQSLERVQEFTVQPEQFQKLAPTALMVPDNNDPQIFGLRVLDCSPCIITNEGVS